MRPMYQHPKVTHTSEIIIVSQESDYFRRYFFTFFSSIIKICVIWKSGVILSELIPIKCIKEMIDRKQNRRYHNAFERQKGLCQLLSTFVILVSFSFLTQMSGCSPSLHACWNNRVLEALHKSAQAFVFYMSEASSWAVVGDVTLTPGAPGLSSGSCLLLFSLFSWYWPSIKWSHFLWLCVFFQHVPFNLQLCEEELMLWRLNERLCNMSSMNVAMNILPFITESWFHA